MGLSGVADGSYFKSNTQSVSSDLLVETSFSELLRSNGGVYKDNSGIALTLSTSINQGDGLLSIAIQGNYSRYLDGYAYDAYQGHRVTGYSSVNGLVFVDEHDLNTLHALKFSIRRKGDLFTLGYQY